MRAIEQRIEEAIRNGEFQDLPGEGKAMSLPDSQGELLHRLLNEHGLSLPWIEAAREIEAELEAARSELLGRWHWYGEQRGRSVGWRRSVALFAERLRTLNQRIAAYNLSVPLPQFQRRPIELQEELARLERS